MFDRNSQKLQYISGGNEAKWSPDSAQILWATPRELAPLGKIHVWVAHLVLVDIRTFERQPLTSGVSYESNFFWCSTGKIAVRELPDRFAQSAIESLKKR